jgi:hypothetical protein
MINGKRLGEVVLCPKIPLPPNEEGGYGVAFMPFYFFLGAAFLAAALGFLTFFLPLLPIFSLLFSFYIY